MASVKHYIYVFITVASIGFIKCDDVGDYDDSTVIPATTEKPISATYDSFQANSHYYCVFAWLYCIIMLTVVITIMFQYMIQVLNRLKKEKDEENKPEEVKKEEIIVEEEIKKPIGSVINAHKEFIEKKKSAEKKWEPETRYRNQGTVFIKSQNVSAADLGIGLDEQEKEAEAKKKKRGGGGISKVKWSDDPIVFYEIGDDFDRFEEMVFDAKGGGFSSSSVMTATIKKL